MASRIRRARNCRVLRKLSWIARWRHLNVLRRREMRSARAKIDDIDSLRARFGPAHTAIGGEGSMRLIRSVSSGFRGRSGHDFFFLFSL